MQREGLIKDRPVKEKRKSKPYEQMTHPGERIQIDVKVVPQSCLANKEERLYPVYRYRWILSVSNFRCLSGAKHLFVRWILEKINRQFQKLGVKVECVQTDNGFEFANRFSNSQKDKLTLFEKTAQEPVFVTILFSHIHPDIMEKWNAVIEKTKNFFMILIPPIPLTTLVGS